MKFRSMIALLAIVAISCKSGSYSNSDKGYEYKIYSNGKGEKLKEGDVISGMQRTYIMHANGKDSFLGPQNIEHFPIKQADKFSPFTYKAIADVLFMAGKGDSVSIIIPTDSLMNDDPSLKKGEKVRFDIFIKDVIDQEAYKKVKEEERQKMIANGGEMVSKMNDFAMSQRKLGADQVKKDSIAINNWLKSHKITTAHRTPTGLYYIIDQPGTGDTIKPYQNVEVGYTGRLLNGTGFDSSTTRGPFPVQVGVSRVIIGWHLGLIHFNKGTKGRLLIPSYLAYGPNSPNPAIPANSPLLFEIKIEDVK